MIKSNRISLPHGCSRSEFVVFPKNWERTTKIDEPWYFQCKFYDPEFAEKHPFGKEVRIKGDMNMFKTVAERKKLLLTLRADMKKDFEEGYNPYHKRKITVPKFEQELKVITKDAPFLKALDFALARHRGVEAYRMDIKSALRYIHIAARHFGYDKLPIGDIHTEHISNILEYCQANDINWTNKRYNKVKGELAGLFRYLLEKRAATSNAPRDVKKLPEKKADREVITDEDFQRVQEYLYKWNRPFYKFVMLFYFSGGREIELMYLKGRGVNLAAQTYKCEINKQIKEDVTRTIQTPAVPFWKEQMENCKPDDYVFSRKLLPGPLWNHPKHLGKRWKRWVKIPLGITADIYSLKHLNAGKIVKVLGLEAAAYQLGHKSTQMVKERYGKKAHEEAMHERLVGLVPTV